jgi:hypothetical protein
MELNEFKEMWKREQEQLMARIDINEKRINEITIQKSISKIEEYMNIFVKGRNMTFLYASLSLILAWLVRENLMYSLPAVIAAIAMMISFVQHFSLKRVNYSVMNIIELQSAINKFQIHILKYSKYDMGVVALWFLTAIPIFLKIVFKLAVFSNFIALGIFISSGTLILLKLFSLDIYKIWDKELKDAQASLNKIKEFELE